MYQKGFEEGIRELTESRASCLLLAIAFSASASLTRRSATCPSRSATLEFSAAAEDSFKEARAALASAAADSEVASLAVKSATVAFSAASDAKRMGI